MYIKAIEFMLPASICFGPESVILIPSRQARVKMSSEKSPKYIYAQESKLSFSGLKSPNRSIQSGNIICITIIIAMEGIEKK